MKKLKGYISLILVICFIFAASPMASAQEYGSYMEAMIGFMTEMYYEGLTDEEALISVLKGIFSELDDYSAFYDKEETMALINSLSNSYQGIGVALQESDDGIKVVEVYENSPAEKAGLHTGDIIIAVDGESVEGMDVTSAALLIRGASGTEVRLTVIRDGWKMDLFVTRGSVIIKSVKYRIEGRIGYISIDNFDKGTSREFDEAISEMDNANIKKIILDLRGNPGGYVDEAVAVARKLMPKGIITTLDYKSEKFDDQVFYSYGNHPDYIIAVLVDENSASASEILAGALEDSGVGFLIGQTTYGKGVFQNMFSILTPEAYNKYNKMYGGNYVTNIEWLSNHGVWLDDDDEIIGAVKLTTGHYLTPRGRFINGIGLKPVFVEPNPIYPGEIDLSKVGPVKDPIELNAYDNNVYNAERILKAAGYLKKADRLYDNDTVESVKQFQADNRLPTTGKIDLSTLKELNDTLSELRINNDKQYTKALETLNCFQD